MKKILILIVLILFFSSCKTTEESKRTLRSGKDYDELMKGEQSIIIGGKELKPEIYIWRDLMPVTDPSTSGIFITIRLSMADGSDIPSNLRFNKIWVFDKDTIWETTAGITPGSGTKVAELYARNGPVWKPETILNVAFDIQAGTEKKLFLVKDQKVNAVY